MVSQHSAVPGFANVVVGVCLVGALTLIAFALPSAAQNSRPSSPVERTGSAQTRLVKVPEVTEQWHSTATTVTPRSVAVPKAVRFIGHTSEYEAAKREANAFAQIRRKTAGSLQSISAVQTDSSTSPINFDGPSEADTEFIPPDPVVAAGPNNIVVVINSLLGVYDKTGVLQGGFQDLNNFFSSLGLTGEIFDPRIIFDQLDGRFILSAAEVDFTNFTNGRVLVAVSSTSDPTGAWNKFAIDFLGRDSTNTSNTFPDFPGLGLSATDLYLTSNQFILNSQCSGDNPTSPCRFSDAWITAIALPELLSGNSSLQITRFKNISTASGKLAFGIQPALTYGPIDSEYLVAASFSSNPGNVLNLFSINTSGTLQLEAADLSVPNFSFPPDAEQGGSPELIQTDDFRMLNAVWSNGSLWCGQNVSSSSGAPLARWYQIQATSLTSASLLQSGDVAAAGEAYYPALSAGPDGTVAMAFTTSNSLLPASSAVTGRGPTDAAGTMREYAIYRLGLGPYDEQVGNRWGDYSGISIDPVDSSFWVMTEYAGTPDPHFSTAIEDMINLPSVATSTNLLEYGGVLSGRSSPAQSVTFSNVGTVNMTPSAVTLTGANAADFSITVDHCTGVSLPAGQGCVVSVVFTPSLIRTPESAFWVLTYSAGLVVIRLTGTGIVEAVLNVSPTSINFPPTVQQASSLPQIITVSNTGNATADIRNISIGGAFTEVNNCGLSLVAGANCQFTVTFRPFSSGSFQFLFQFNSQAGSFFVNLKGIGISAPSATACPASLNFGNQAQGTPSQAQPVILTNSGSAPLTITGVTISGDFSESDNCGGGLGPSANCRIHVVFTPTALGSRNGQIAVYDDAAGSPQIIPLNGNGTSTSTTLEPALVAPQSTAEADQLTNEGIRHHFISTDRPLGFEKNTGQFDPTLQFVAHASGYALGITQKGLRLNLHGQARQGSERPKFAQVEMTLIGASVHAVTSALDELPGKTNYFLGKDPMQWRTGVPIYSRIRTNGIYPGVDLVYYGHDRSLEYDFVVAPGGNPAKIRLNFNGTSGLRISDSGDLLVHTSAGDIQLHRPVVYQTAKQGGSVPDGRTYRSGRWIVENRSVVAFQIGPYDHGRKLVIDPVLSFATYLGGSGGEIGEAIAVDSNKNVYIAGITYSMDFPVTPTAFLKTCGNTQFPCEAYDIPREDGFVTKLSPDGSTLLYATYLGGSFGSTDIHGIAVDSSGNAYVTGPTFASTFPTTSGALKPQCTLIVGPNVCANAFVTKLDSTGSTLIYSTFLGGTPTFTGANISLADVANAIAVNSNGNAFIGGAAGSPDFPVISGAFQTSPPAPGTTHGFLSVLNPTGTALVFSTFLGGTGKDVVNGVALDPLNNVYVTGNANSLDFPTTPGALQTGSYGGDAFVAKFNSSGKVIYSTLLRGVPGNDNAAAIAADSSGAAYITGMNFGYLVNGSSPGVVQKAPLGAFIGKLHAAGCALLYGTNLNPIDPGSRAFGTSIAVDSSGVAYVGGYADDNQANYALVNPIQPLMTTTQAQGFGFISEIDPTGSSVLLFSPLGGSQLDNVKAIGLDSDGSLYATGMARSQDFPVKNALQPVCIACLDVLTNEFGATAFVAKIVPAAATGVSLTRSSLMFGSVPVGTTLPQIQAVGLENNQSVPLNIQKVTLDGAGYLILPNLNYCNGTIAPHKGCVITMEFLPTVGGPAPGTLTITDDGPGSPHIIALSAFGSASFALADNPQQTGQLVKGATSVNYFVNVDGVYYAPTPTGSIQLGCSGNGALTCVFNPPSISVGTPSVLTIGNLAAISGDSFPLTITGTLGTQTASRLLQITLADFSISAPPTPETVSAGQPAIFNGFTISPINGLTGVVSTSCSNLPLYAACQFSLPTLVMDGTDSVSTNLTVATSSSSLIAPHPKVRTLHIVLVSSFERLAAVSIICLLILSNWNSRFRRIETITFVLLLILCTSCGGGGASAPSSPPGGGISTTPSGTYLINVNFQAGATLQKSVQISMTIK
jgi:Beta-propeller repeat/HYDIN/CFA65/VesB-like, Ig-like domain